MTDQGPPPTPGAGSAFCAECGAAMPADAHFCGNCGAAPPPAAAGDPAAPGVSGASTWQGVQPVVERPTDGGPAVPVATAGAGAAAGGPPTGSPTGPPTGPPGGGPPSGPPGGPPPTEPKGKSKTPLIIGGIVLLVVILGAVLLLTGGGDDNQDENAFNRDDAETTTTVAGDTTTTTAADEETTTTSVDDSTAGITFVAVQDATGTLVVEVPDTWQADGTPLADGSPNIFASPDPASFTGLAASGLSYTRLAGTPDPDATIDAFIPQAGLDTICTVTDDRQDYTDGVFTGRIQVFEGCGGAGASVFEIVASRADGATVQVTTIIVDPDPVGIFNHIQTTFNLLV